MTLEEFSTEIKSANAIELAIKYLHRESVHAIPDVVGYRAFIEEIREDYSSSDHISVVGSGNWKFSLNPYKNFTEYHSKSDVDIAIICRASFEEVWGELRAYHRKNFYLISRSKKEDLKRSGENVYSGFISPKWIPEKSLLKHKYVLNANKYSSELIGFRNVNMMYFKNQDEALDYYKRSFLWAQRKGAL